MTTIQFFHRNVVLHPSFALENSPNMQKLRIIIWHTVCQSHFSRFQHHIRKLMCESFMRDVNGLMNYGICLSHIMSIHWKHLCHCYTTAAVHHFTIDRYSKHTVLIVLLMPWIVTNFSSWMRHTQKFNQKQYQCDKCEVSKFKMPVKLLMKIWLVVAQQRWA